MAIINYIKRIPTTNINMPISQIQSLEVYNENYTSNSKTLTSPYSYSGTKQINTAKTSFISPRLEKLPSNISEMNLNQSTSQNITDNSPLFYTKVLSSESKISDNLNLISSKDIIIQSNHSLSGKSSISNVKSSNISNAQNTIYSRNTTYNNEVQQNSEYSAIYKFILDELKKEMKN